MDAQSQMPLTGYGGQYPMDVAGLSDPEMYATSQAYGLGQPSSLDAMALSQIMAMPSYGYAGPTTGNPTASPLLPGQAMDMLQSQYGVLPQGYGQPQVQPMGPAPGGYGSGMDPYTPGIPGGWTQGPNGPIPPGGPGTPGGSGGGPNNGGHGSDPNTQAVQSGPSQGTPQVAERSAHAAAASQSQGGSMTQPRMPVNPVDRPQGLPQEVPPGNRPPQGSGPVNGGWPTSPGNPFDPPSGGGPRDSAPNGGVQMAGGPSGSTWRAVNDAAANGSGVRTSGVTPFGQSPGIGAAYQSVNGQPAVNAGYARVSGQGIADDPAIAQALANFRQSVAPGIQNDAAMAGLGNSSAMVNALSQTQGQMLEPLYQDAFAREQHTQDRGYGAMENEASRQQHVQDRGYGATEEELARRERSYVRGAEAQQGATDRLMQMSQMQNQRQGGAIGTLAQLGGTERGVEQQGNESAYNDMLRRQALSEAALYQPFGGMLPSAFGSRQVSTGK